MLFLKSWLEEYVNLSSFTNQQIADTLTVKSSEVDEIKEIKDYFGGKVLVGKIENLRQHPDADKLKIFDVNLGQKGKVQIVSAAPNSREGLIVPVALDGANLPGFTIQSKPLRGEKSQGMCCGKSEILQETPFSDGLWELNGETGDEDLGKLICEVKRDLFPLETIFDVSVLPDRIGMIGSHLGMAVELATIFENPNLLTPKAKELLNPEKVIQKIQAKVKQTSEHKIQFEDQTGYTRSFNLFKIKLSEGEYFLDKDLKKKLFLTGKNITGTGGVDLSNFLLWDLGQPNHFFSFKKLMGENQKLELDWKIEKLKTETGFKGLGQLKKATLPKGLEVLKEGDKIIHIPGVSGGKSTSLEADDNQILLELANFPGDRVARSTFALNYRSDGSRIWAGEVNPRRILLFLARMIQVLGEKAEFETILTWLGGETIENFESEILNLTLHKEIKIDPEYISKKLDKRGLDFWNEIIDEKLKNFGEIENGILKLNPFYHSIFDQDDLVISVGRLYGFDNLPKESLVFEDNWHKNQEILGINKLKKLVASFGFQEIITRPFVDKNDTLAGFNESESNLLELANSHRSDFIFLRDSLILTTIRKAGENIKLGIKEPRIFEFNKSFTLQKADSKEKSEHSPQEEKTLCVVEFGGNPYKLTTLAKEILERLNPKEAQIKIEEFEDNSGKGYIYKSGEVEIKVLQVKNKLKKHLEVDLKKQVWSLEAKFGAWDGKFRRYKKYQDESNFPNISRSYSFIIPHEIQWDEIKNCIQKVEFEGTVSSSPTERIDGKDNSILNFNLKFVNYSRTLNGEEIAEFENELEENLKKISPEITKR